MLAGAPPPLEEPAPAKWGKALQDFDGSGFGSDYLSFKEGEELGVFKGKEVSGWAYGVVKDGAEGWFPPDFWGLKGNQLAPPRNCPLHKAAEEEEAKQMAKAAAAASLAEGVVKVFFPERRYGFIDSNGLDVFLHFSDCGTQTPRVGDTLKFSIERRASNPKQLQAKSVTFTGHQNFVSQNQKGEVKSVASGYGFIVNGGGDVFFRMASCDGVPMPGDAVTFDVKWSEVRPGVLEAVNVRCEKGPGSPTSNRAWKEKHPEIAVVREFAAVVTQLTDRAEAAETESKLLAEKLKAAEKKLLELDAEIRALKAPKETPERTM